jgi:hypothetical protein
MWWSFIYSPCPWPTSSLLKTTNLFVKAPTRDAETGPKPWKTAQRGPRNCLVLSPSENPTSLVGSLQRCQPWTHAGRKQGGNGAETGQSDNHETRRHVRPVILLLKAWRAPRILPSSSSSQLPTFDSSSSLPALVAQSLLPIRQSYSNDCSDFPPRCEQYLDWIEKVCSVSAHTFSWFLCAKEL